MNFTYFYGEHPTSRERFILPIKPARSRELNPFHRKHHIKHLMLHRKGDRTRRLLSLRGIGVTPLYATVTRLEPSFNTTARPLAPWCCHFSEVWHLQPSFRNRTGGGALSLPAGSDREGYTKKSFRTTINLSTLAHTSLVLSSVLPL